MTLAPRSLKCLEGVHPDLVRVVKRADELGARFHITEGLRSLKVQKEMKAKGRSKTLDSRHLTGHAVDFVACLPDGSVSYDMEDMRPVADKFRDAAAELGVKITRGIDWGWDSPHIELDRKAYPANGSKPNSVTEEPNSVSAAPAVKPLVKSRTLWNMVGGTSLLTWLGDWVQAAFGVATAAASQYASMGAGREFLATLGGNGKAVGIAVGVGCIVSAMAAKVDDHNKQQEGAGQ